MQRFFTLLICVLLLSSCGKMGALKKAGVKLKAAVSLGAHKLSCESVSDQSPACNLQDNNDATVNPSVTAPSRYNWDAKMAIW